MQRFISSFRSSEASSQRSDARERTNPQASGSNTFGRTLYEHPSSSRQGDQTGVAERRLIMENPQQYAEKLLKELPLVLGTYSSAKSRIENLAQKVSHVEKWNATLNALEKEKNIPRHILDSHDASNSYFEYGQALKSALESWQDQQFSHRAQIEDYKNMAGEPGRTSSQKEVLLKEINKDINKISQIDTFLTRQKAEYQQRVPQSYQLPELRNPE